MGWFIFGAIVGGFLATCMVVILGVNKHTAVQQCAADIKLFCLVNDCKTCLARRDCECIFDGCPAGWDLDHLSVDKNGIDSTRA